MTNNSRLQNAKENKLSGFDNWNFKDWNLYYNANHNIEFKSRRINSDSNKLLKLNLKDCVFILGRINFLTYVERVAGLRDNFYRLDIKAFVLSLSYDEFVDFDKKRQILQDLEYVYPSLVEFSINNSKHFVVHYEIGVLTPKGLDFYSSVNGNHLLWKYYYFRIKQCLLWIAAFGGVASVVSLLIQLFPFFKKLWCVFFM